MLTPKRFLAAWAALTVLLAGVAIAAPSGLAALGLGRWELREIGSKAPPRAVCISNALQLIQLYHPGIACQRFTIDDDATQVTMQYTCPGKGYGRTTVRLESGVLIKLDTQGFAPDGQPFDVSYEGRRTGDCPPAHR